MVDQLLWFAAMIDQRGKLAVDRIAAMVDQLKVAAMIDQRVKLRWLIS